MVDLNQMRIFVEVARRGGIGAAALSLEIPKSTVSLRVKQLEERLGLRLLQRTTRQVTLTGKGKHYFEYCERIISLAEEADRSLAALRIKPYGTLRVASFQLFADLFLTPLITDFLALHDEVEIQTIISEDLEDLVGESIDLALRMGPLQDSTLISRRLGCFETGLYSSTDFAKSHPPLTHPNQLDKLPLVAYGNSWTDAPWTFQKGEQREDVPLHGRFLSNSIFMVAEATLRGVGIGGFPKLLAEKWVKQGKMVRLLPEWDTPKLPLYALYASRNQIDLTLSSFLEFIYERIDSDTLRNPTLERL